AFLFCLSAACGLATLAQTGASASPATAAANPEDTVTLELGKTVERELSGGQKHIYLLPLTAGQYAKVEIKEHGINVAFTFQRRLADSTPRRRGHQQMVSVRAACGRSGRP